MLPGQMQEPMQMVYQDVCSLRMKVGLFIQVYGESTQQVDLLNRIAALFFRVCQDAQFHDIVLCLCRLSEKSRSQGRTNLSLQFLVENVDRERYGQLRCLLDEKIEDLVAMTRELRQYRNRLIAHRDLETARGAEPLPELVMSRVTGATERVEDLFYLVLEHFYPDVEFARGVFGLVGDGTSLIKALEDAERYRLLRRRRA